MRKYYPIKTIYAADFETTVYDGQEDAQVWAAGVVPLYTEDAVIWNNIYQFIDFLFSIRDNIRVYFHNLRFDGSFILANIINETGYQPAYEQVGDTEIDVAFLLDWQMPKRSYKYSVSDRGQWYSVTIKNSHGCLIEIWDSIKLLPFSLKKIGKDFKTKHQKTEIEYIGRRAPFQRILPDEEEYLKNDLFVLKEALEIMFSQGHDKITIGACCLAEWKQFFNLEFVWGGVDFNRIFPDLTKVEIDTSIYGSSTADEYVRKSYKGGWCYVVPEKADKVKRWGITVDYNSMYPSMMLSESGNYYPSGMPRFWSGDYIPDRALMPNAFYYIRVRTRFYVKPGMLPCIQIKGSWLYRGNEWLSTSDVYSRDKDEYLDYYVDRDGTERSTEVTLTFSQVDWELVKEHYYLPGCEILDGCYFTAIDEIFDTYIEKWRKVKETSTGSVRAIAKLFSNNLYGKLGANDDSSFKVILPDENGVLHFHSVERHTKTPGYVPIGAAITSYARNTVVRAAQANYYGPDCRGFIYADTDSLHMDLAPDELVGLSLHPTKYCHWGVESQWDWGRFIRQKTYLEHVTYEGDKRLSEPYYDIKCAGLPDNVKNDILAACGTREERDAYLRAHSDNMDERNIRMVEDGMSIDDFRPGLTVGGKLMPVRYKSGIALKYTTFTIK